MASLELMGVSVRYENVNVCVPSTNLSSSTYIKYLRVFFFQTIASNFRCFQKENITTFSRDASPSPYFLKTLYAQM